MFSITTIASSTTIPRAKRKENKTIMFKLKPKLGITKNARNILNGTDKPTKMAFVAPIKNINISVTNINPMIIVLIKS